MHHAGLLGKMSKQQGNILAPIPERRQHERGNGKTIVEIGSKAALGRHFTEIALDSGNDPAVDGNRRIGAKPFQSPLLQNAQQLDLNADRRGLHFVEKQRATVRMLDLADAALGGAGERTSLVAEQFAFDQMLRQTARN